MQRSDKVHLAGDLQSQSLVLVTFLHLNIGFCSSRCRIRVSCSTQN